MDYLCAKFGDFSFSRFGFIVRTDIYRHRITDRQPDIQTDRQRESQTRMIAILT